MIFGATMLAARGFIRRAVIEASEARELAEARGRDLTLDLIGSGVAGFLPKLSTTEIVITATDTL